MIHVALLTVTLAIGADVTVTTTTYSPRPIRSEIVCLIRGAVDQFTKGTHDGSGVASEWLGKINDPRIDHLRLWVDDGYVRFHYRLRTDHLVIDRWTYWRPGTIVLCLDASGDIGELDNVRITITGQDLPTGGQKITTTITAHCDRGFFRRAPIVSRIMRRELCRVLGEAEDAIRGVAEKGESVGPILERFKNVKVRVRR